MRTTYSKTDIASRHWLVEKMTQANLDACIDGVGNVYGRSQQPGRCVLVGSHSDTQPSGGWLDGALGVIYGLEVARAIAECKQTRHLAVDVISWADEEGSYLGMIGSRSFCNLLDDKEIKAAIGIDGRSLTDALRDCGLINLPLAQYDLQRHIGYLEAHIEQGPFLEKQNKKIGVVTSIVGMRDFEIVFTGQQNHAGTTPMLLRKDAGMALIEFAHDLVHAVGDIAGEKTVWTIGKVELEPGAPSIIPVKAKMLWQFRDPDQSRIEDLQKLTEEKVKVFNETQEVRASLTLLDDSAQATNMDNYFQSKLAESAQSHCPEQWIHMPSGAVHDAQTLSKRMPSAMLFIPSIGGISHSFEEDSHEQDIILGCQVLTDAVANILLDNAKSQ